MKNGIVQFGSRTIEYRLEYGTRKTLGITVTSGMEVRIKAPANAPLDKIEAQILKKAPWILRQLGYFLSFQPKIPMRKYVSGETHLYLGRQYRLKVVTGKHESVKLHGKFIEVTTSDKSQVQGLLNQWYTMHAKVRFHAIAAPLIERFSNYGVRPSAMVLRVMPTRWGSCTPKGRIILNPELIKAPRGCIEYVIIHELCHLVHLNHNTRFLELQSREMPDWEKWKERLERMLA